MWKFNRKQAICIAVLLLVFAIIKLVALLWWNNQQPEATKMSESACDVRVGCTLPNGAEVKFNHLISAKAPFGITVTRVSDKVGGISVSFSMHNMDMGFNRYKLLRRVDGSWVADKIWLPMCVQGRYDYLADIHIGTEVFQVSFTADAE